MKKIPIRHLTSALQEKSTFEQFKIRKLEDVVGDKDLFHDLHRHDFFFILVVKTGKGKHEIDFTTYKITENSVYFVRPGQVHQLEMKAGSTGFLLEFSSEFYHPKNKTSKLRLRKAANKNYCCFRPEGFNKFIGLLMTILNEFNAREEGYEDVIKSSLEIVFIEYVRQTSNSSDVTAPANSYSQERFEEFLELMDKYIGTHKQVSEYTEMMNLSSYQLNQITKSSIGKTASELINEHIILEAKRYLLATSNQIKDIADQLGYEDASYFIRFFKKLTGLSPQTFRTKL